MKPEASPFETAWWMTGLKDYRRCSSTYCRFGYHTLPHLDSSHLNGSFNWMPEIPDLESRGRACGPQDVAQIRRDLLTYQAKLAEHSISYPSAFLNLLHTPERLSWIPSCTACYFEVIPPIPSPLNDGAWLQTFLFDQQAVLVWSLYLLPNGDHAVVTEPESFGAWMLQMMGEEYTPSDPGKFRQATQFVGEDFESFVIGECNKFAQAATWAVWRFCWNGP